MTSFRPSGVCPVYVYIRGDGCAYRAFQITFDEWVPKFVRNFRSSRRIWQFDYEVANQVANFETKLGSSRGRHLRLPPRLKFVDIFGAVMDPFNRAGKEKLSQTLIWKIGWLFSGTNWMRKLTI